MASSRRDVVQLRPRTVALCWANVLVFAALPIVAVLSMNLGTYPINVTVLARDLAALTVATGFLIWSLGYLGWAVEARAAWLCVFLLGCNQYVFVPVPAILEGRAASASPLFAAGYLAVCAAVASITIRPWKAKRRDPVALSVVAGVLLAMTTYQLVPLIGAGTEESWGAAVDRLTSPPPPTDEGRRPERDVYVIVLDAFGRPDVLRDTYDLDLSPVVSSLKEKGFQVPSHGRSNYAQTFLSLASMLNMAYLDDVADALGPASRDRRPLRRAIENNALMRAAKQAGFQVVAIGSDYTATDSFPHADVCVCPVPFPHELEYVALSRTPFADLGRNAWIAWGRRRHVLSAFDALERAAHLPGRKFVFAHIISPHPPFVFGENGEARVPPERSPFIHGEWLARATRARPEFGEEYVRGYREQAAFIAKRMVRFASVLLSQPGPKPAIMIVGDHGPALELDIQDIDRTNLRERMSVFSAYYLPDVPQIDDAISPVNGIRMLADRFMGVHMPPLPERSAFSTLPRPYAMRAVVPDYQ